MIYEVYLDGQILYYPDDEQYVIKNARLTQALNDSGEFEFEVPASNPLYGDIMPRRGMLQVLRDGKEIFYGEVREAEETLDFVKRIYAVGELVFLFDSIQPQGRYQNNTVRQFFETLIYQHNSQVEEKKRFEVGVVTVTDPNDSIYRYTNYEDTLTALRDKLCDRLDGYLRIRKENGKRYLDLVRLEDYGKTSDQKIEFGENLLEYAANLDGNSIATAVIPLGARLDTSEVEGLDAYTTIKSVNNGRDYVFSQTAVDRFGWIRRVVNFDDVTLPENLKRKGEQWLASNQFEELTLQLNALDMSILDCDIDGLELGDMIHAVAEPFGMSTVFPLQAKVTYLQEHDKNYITLGNTQKKPYTQQISAATNDIQEKIPQASTILNEAKSNSSDLIKAATSGYITMKMGEKGNPEELLIMDTNDINTATKVWRWNINGLGYSSSGYNGRYGTAITMDGKIVADYILAGTMIADRIKGGILRIGGINNENGLILIIDKNGNQIGKWDKDGIDAFGTFSARGISEWTGEDREAKLINGTLKLLKSGTIESVFSAAKWDGGKYATAIGSALEALTFGIVDRETDKLNSYYVLNNGLDPNGMKERHLFNQRVRTINGMVTPAVFFTDSGTNISEWQWVKVFGNADGVVVDGNFTVKGELKNTEISNMKSSMDDITASMDELTERVGWAYEMIAEINGRIDALYSRVDALERKK